MSMAKFIDWSRGDKNVEDYDDVYKNFNAGGGDFPAYVCFRDWNSEILGARHWHSFKFKLITTVCIDSKDSVFSLLIDWRRK
jgi:hypothetical protein